MDCSLSQLRPTTGLLLLNDVQLGPQTCKHRLNAIWQLLKHDVSSPNLFLRYDGCGKSRCNGKGENCCCADYLHVCPHGLVGHRQGSSGPCMYRTAAKGRGKGDLKAAARTKHGGAFVVPRHSIKRALKKSLN